MLTASVFCDIMYTSSDKGVTKMRTKYLKRSIKGTKANCRFVNLATNEIMSDYVFVSGVFGDKNKLFKAIEKDVADGFRLIAIDSTEVVINVYRITEENFKKYGELVTK